MVFTGLGEPTRRLEVLLAVARRLRAAGVARVRVDTDGLASLREGFDVPPLLADAGISALSVSLNAPDAATYARCCPSRHGEAAYDAVKAFIRCAVGCIPDVAASAVALPGLSRRPAAKWPSRSERGSAGDRTTGSGDQEGAGLLPAGSGVSASRIALSRGTGNLRRESGGSRPRNHA